VLKFKMTAFRGLAPNNLNLLDRMNVNAFPRESVIS